MNGNEIEDRALAGMRSAFENSRKNGSAHDPSDTQWQGLRQIVKTIEGMACRLQDAPESERQNLKGWSPSFYASFLDCGVGKTTALIQTVKAILEIPKYDHVSFVIFLSRLEEIKTLAERMGLDKQTFAVISSDETYNDLGNPEPKKARVLFTTQKMLEKQSQLRQLSFTSITDFYYQGKAQEPKPRQVRIWDEAILPSSIFTLDTWRILRILAHLGELNLYLRNAIYDFVTKTLDKSNDSDLIQMPIFSQYGIGMQEARSAVYPDDADIVEALFNSEGRVVRVSKDKVGTTTIEYQDFLPDDLKPMLILDASGRQRKTYELWADYRKDLKTLYSPEKDYTGFTIHHWDEGAGKGA